jgi:hypothetical protein|nr:MAG TPA: hypothetical protein [Crassvirales sp.]
MKHIAFIDFGIESVPYKNVNIESDIDAETVEKILNAVSERFKIIVRQRKKNVDSTDKFYSLEEAINIIKYSKVIYTSYNTEPTETYKKIKDGHLTYDKFKKKKIVIKDGIAYYVTVKNKVHVRKYTIPNTKNNNDIIVEEL